MYASLTDIGFPQDRPLELPEAHQLSCQPSRGSSSSAKASWTMLTLQNWSSENWVYYQFSDVLDALKTFSGGSLPLLYDINNILTVTANDIGDLEWGGLGTAEPTTDLPVCQLCGAGCSVTSLWYQGQGSSWAKTAGSTCLDRSLLWWCSVWECQHHLGPWHIAALFLWSLCNGMYFSNNDIFIFCNNSL